MFYVSTSMTHIYSSKDLFYMTCADSFVPFFSSRLQLLMIGKKQPMCISDGELTRSRRPIIWCSLCLFYFFSETIWNVAKYLSVGLFESVFYDATFCFVRLSFVSFLARTILIWQKLCVNTCKLILSTSVYNLSFYVLDSSCFNAQGSCMCFSTRVDMFSHLVEATLEFLNSYGCTALFLPELLQK